MTDKTIQIIRRAQVGDRQAFAALFEQYKNMVFQSAYLLLNDTQDAEDALQEVFVRVYRSLSAYDPDRGAFTTWLHRITLNHCLNNRRRQSFKNALHLDEVLLKSDFPDAHLANEEALWLAIRALSEKLRVVVILRYAWELPYAEIAQILEIPLGTVKSRLDQAIKTLRSMLDQQDFFPAPRAEIEANDEL